MDLMRSAKTCLGALDHIILSPSVTFGISSYNKNTGKSSGTSSLSLSTSASLLKMLIFFLSLMMFLRGISLFIKAKRRRFYKKWAKKKQIKQANS